MSQIPTDAIPSNLRALLDACQQDFAAADANTDGTGGGWWPPAGKHECFVTDVTFDEAKWTDSQGQKHGGVFAQFHYQLSDAGRVSAGLEAGHEGVCRGRGFRIFPPTVSKQMPEGSQRAQQMTLERLKGHCKTLLGYSDEQLKASPAQLLAACKEKSKASPLVVVNFQVTAGKVKPGSPPNTEPASFRDEFITELVSG